GAPQLNRMRDLISKGLVKALPTSRTAAGHTVYRIALTAKGEGAVKRHEAAAAKLAAAGEVTTAAPKAKAKAKAKAKVTVAPATAPAPAVTPAPANEAPPVTNDAAVPPPPPVA